MDSARRAEEHAILCSKIEDLQGRWPEHGALHGSGGPGDLATHRVGPLVAYTFHNRPSGARFDEPTLLLLVQWHAQHPYRAGQERNAGIPLIALAFQFQGDLWTSKR